MPDIEEFLQPISESSPAGEDVRYEIVYDEIREAREFDPPELEATRRDDDPPLRVADHKEVRKLAEGVLRDRSKHLQIAAWLSEAWTYLEGLAGFASGVELQRRLLDEFWDSLYPEVDDGDLDYRMAPLEWTDRYLGAGLDLVPLTAGGLTEPDFQEATQEEKYREEGDLTREEWDKQVAKGDKPFYKTLAADIGSAVAAVERLRGVSEERFGEDAPTFRVLREKLARLERIVSKILEQKLAEDPDPVDLTSVVSESPSPESTGDGGGVPLDPVSREDAGARVAAAARFLRSHDATDPAPYLMVRGLRWGELRKGGAEVDPRLLAAPPTRTRTHLKGLLLDQQWPALLEAAEDVMATPFGRGWLDLQRYVFTALGGLGPEFEAVERSLKSALRSLLVDLPGLPDLTLMDDTATANRQTRVWLQEEGLLGPLTEEERGRLEVATASAVAVGRDPRERARELVRAGQPQKAIELLMRAADDEGSPRGRALRRAEAAGIMVDNGLAQVALPVLRDVKERIETHTVGQWEAAETMARPLALLVRCLDVTGESPADRDALYLKVCELDPMQAMELARAAEEVGGDDEEATNDDGVEEA